MELVMIDSDQDEQFIWVRKVTTLHTIVPGFDVTIEQWEVIEDKFDVEPLSVHETFESARDYAYFYLTGKVRDYPTLWEFAAM